MKQFCRLFKLTLDTATLISASFRLHSVPSQAYLKALDEFEVCVSEATFSELETVIKREKFNAYLPLEDRLSFLEMYKNNAVWFDVTESIFDCRDPNDNKFLELAITVGADIIVSSDPDLHILNPYRNIAILKPAEFLG